MNIVLFRHDELNRPLPLYDHRARHIIRVLKCGVGDTFDGGIAGGFRGKVRIEAIRDGHMELDFMLDEPPDALLPVTLIVGLCRPQTVRKVLREAGAIGVSRIVFVPCEKSELSYADSKLWTNGEVPACLLEGAGQAFSTSVPDVMLARGFVSAIRGVSGEAHEADNGSSNAGEPGFRGATLIALDNYEATGSLREIEFADPAAVLAVGPERGWSENERHSLRAEGFVLAAIGQRVLRVETACVVGLSLVLAGMKLI